MFGKTYLEFTQLTPTQRFQARQIVKNMNVPWLSADEFLWPVNARGHISGRPLIGKEAERNAKQRWQHRRSDV
jgi:hypothetical protein